ncbi:ATP-binding protein [Chlorogloeopsis sp. ULAP01]|uniref:ATP-binding protein n=1 Tax=Chlorogloeopsis sp. ULAP01 TaxID=3056483 RepID=UPI0025AAD2AE|nr:ATP-binding protein [Chlorogloeopsis sp. ULAP01]MDM9384955.1 ATP-binding protein [Chlorogloeopsis sp. ULAP01]
MNRLRILHLEDAPMDVELIQRILTKGGFECEIFMVNSGSEYIAALDVNSFDLILSDSRVSDFTGYAAFEIAKKKCPNIPFILVSANTNPEEITNYLNEGVVDCISKNQLWQLVPIARRAIAESRLEQYNQAMERLVKVVQELSLARSLDEITAIVRIAARELTGADGATFVLREGDMCFYADENAIQPLWKGRRFPVNICIGGWCMQHKQQVIIENVYEDERIPYEAYKPTFIKSLVMVPIRKEAPIGAIGNYWATPHLATTEEIGLIQALADTTSVAIENIQVYQELETRVRDRTAQLEAANQELEAFAYTLSHDLRSPLSAIDGYSSLLLSEYGNQLDERAKFFLNRLCVACDRMNAQIEHMLSLHKLSQTEIQPQTVNLSQIAQEILANLKANEPHRQVETTIQEGLVVYGDSILLRVVLENLLSNAWKYTAKRKEAKIEFGAALESDSLPKFYVRDNGAGFNMKYAQKLFRPFQRMHSQKEFSGTGIGLTSVQRIIQKHGGRIWAEAAVDEGATFYFTLSEHRRGDEDKEWREVRKS